jgi:hypothetical protein
VPFVRRGLYDKLAALIGTSSEIKPAVAVAESATANKAVKAEAGSTAAVSTMARSQPAAAVIAEEPRDEAEKEKPQPLQDMWAAITVGSVVLARSPDPEEGWHEAIVLAVASEDNNAVRLRWRDFPTEPQFHMHRHRLALTQRGVS